MTYFEYQAQRIGGDRVLSYELIEYKPDERYSACDGFIVSTFTDDELVELRRRALL